MAQRVRRRAAAQASKGCEAIGYRYGGFEERKGLSLEVPLDAVAGHTQHLNCRPGERVLRAKYKQQVTRGREAGQVTYSRRKQIPRALECIRQLCPAPAQHVNAALRQYQCNAIDVDPIIWARDRVDTDPVHAAIAIQVTLVHFGEPVWKGGLDCRLAGGAYEAGRCHGESAYDDHATRDGSLAVALAPPESGVLAVSRATRLPELQNSSCTPAQPVDCPLGELYPPCPA